MNLAGNKKVDNDMKGRLFVVILILFFANLCGVCLGIDNPPLGSGRVPASSGTSGLVRSPNPIDTSGNLVITGNVGGGKHFRGVVPYRSTTDFGVPLSSSTIIDPFLRRSVSSGNYLRITGRPESYYSLSQTVTSTIPGSSGIIRQPTINIKSGKAGRFVLPALPEKKVLSTANEDILNIGLRPMSRTRRQLEKVLLSDVEKYLHEKRLKAEQLEQKEKQFQHDLKELQEKTTELKEGLIDDDKPLQKSSEPKEGLDFEASAKTSDPLGQIDVYDLMQQQTKDLQKEFEQLKVKESKEQADEKTEEVKSSALDEFSEEQISVKAKTLLGKHKTFASYSTSKFNQYMLAGEEYLKQGKYYLAADAYTMASVYKPSDPLAYAGKSHALFAAGEYMSSALFLSRALEIFPEYANFKVDIAAMIDNQDLLEKRIADIRQWASKSETPELKFLLAYIFYQMNQSEWSRQAINSAYEKMPESAVAALKKAIDAETKQ